MARSPTEWDLQHALCWIWLDGNPDDKGVPRKTPALAPDVVYFHVPNGGSRNEAEGRRLKLSGVKAGVFDLVFLAYQRFYLMELKEPGGPQPPERNLSASQRAMWPRLERAGATALIVTDNLADAKAWLIKHGLALPIS
jgi:hypothetical protein